ncbi:hypothetical protein BASA50_007975 [Batrachochytrium salamandrivorans]|uniref:Uncharacterized protein n=1 Tax=Batrachochytrium salamandrivorans TaxID=1357716 RepID=A0ABQ8F5H2_9FUNG|nr:hypothetical protein BASA62_007115 [Batrachochytrium salamandrivorans]KAH6572019.1 hypothetical protein BASA60_006789 [Batrachochytrium salamandrivorans]KAH6590824.1 hypothetical protein BASA61_005111 [Batrachochytrium salamandrivorans]KAH6592599.1 hypothetical protein BASA50_007975 [Batrachochytrium salamandrivorans]KAH9273350.1 hypothetical protein BASA83_004351 [Batrachochytrium salamandrivorans]
MRSQASLITAMQIKCSRKINRWLHLSRLLSLFVGKRAAIFEHSPRAVSRRDLRTTSDGPSRSSSGRMLSIRSTSPKSPSCSITKSSRRNNTLSSNDGFWVLLSDVYLFVGDQGSVMQTLFSGLSNNHQRTVLVEVLQYIASNKQSATSRTSLLAPLRRLFCHRASSRLCTGIFIRIAILQLYRDRVAKFWSPEVIRADQREL